MKLLEIFNDISAIFPYFLQGYIAIYIWERIIPSSKKQIKDYYLEILVLGIMFKWFHSLLNTIYSLTLKDKLTIPLEIITNIELILLFALAIGLPFLLNNILEKEFFKKRFHSSLDPTAWDAFFKQGNHCYVIVKLKGNDNPIIGYFGEDSFAAPYPHKGDLFLEATYIKVANNNITSLKKRNKTMGIYIKSEEISHIEFLNL